MHSLMARLIKWAVPFLNIFRHPEKWPYTLDDLQKMDKSTLGNVLYQFLTTRGMEYLPKYEVHDAYHALLGYNTTVTGELQLQAFMWGNRNATFAGKILFILGIIVFPSKYRLLKEEIQKGRRVRPLKELFIVDMIPQPVEKLRDGLGICICNSRA